MIKLPTAQIFALAERTSNPFYLYLLSELEKNWISLRTIFPTQFDIHYSLKANSHPLLLEKICSLGAFADVASLGELNAATAAGFSPQQIEFTGPGKTEDELYAACNMGIDSLVVESIQELVQIERIAKALRRKIAVSIRINPKQYITSSGRTITSEPSQFGIDEEQLPDLADIAKCLQHVQIRGSHCHVQSQLMSADDIVSNFKTAVDAALVLQKAIQTPLTSINIGGGLGIPYTNAQPPIDVSRLKRGVADFLQQANVQFNMPTVKFKVELGRYIVGTAGLFVVKVVYLKRSRGKVIAVVNGGFTQCQIACGVGQIIRQNLPISSLPPAGATTGAIEKVSIFGPSCYSKDALGLDVELPKLEPGNLVCIHNVGAYGYSFSPAQFLRQQPADEYCV